MFLFFIFCLTLNFEAWGHFSLKHPKCSQNPGNPENHPSGEGILSGIPVSCCPVEADVLNAEELEDFVEGLSYMMESNGPVMREALLNEDVAVETAHLGNGECGNAAEGLAVDVKDLAFCDVGAKNALAVTLETVEGDVAGSDIALEGASCEIRLGSGGLEGPVLDELVLDGTVGAHLA